MSDRDREVAVELMGRFAERTGLTSGRTPRRYLWTDAFAVCNLLCLARGDELAIRLVDQVHHTLGRHRPDDVRSGWLSGLGPQEAEAHPTRGGLRIGKPLPERLVGEALDERLEWERDGQYFHYLTKWMHALDQVARSTGRATFNRWARELADTAHRAFTNAPRPGAPRRMYWKASIDLSRALVPSMGQHDPLDGFITCVQLDATADALVHRDAGPRLAGAAADFAAMIQPGQLASADPLGLGGLLLDAYRLAQLRRQDTACDPTLLTALLTAALVGLGHYLRQPDLRSSAEHRLAFRELGLAIGLAAIGLMAEDARREPDTVPSDGDARARLAQLARLLPVGAEIEAFWLRPEHRRAASWRAHEDINDVMLATALAPEGFVVLQGLTRGEASVEAPPEGR